ncbi:MAG: HlyD family secretion protein [Hyphomicrobiaceae bacterium]
MSRQSAKRSKPRAEAASGVDHRATEGEQRAAQMNALDGNERIAYLREALEDARWLQHGRRTADTGTGAVRSFKRKWQRLYLPWAHSVRDGLWQREDGATPLADALKSETSRKVLKTAIALAIAVLVGWGPTQRLMQTTSVEAIVNAPLITLRSPIDGELASTPDVLAVGAAYAPGTPILKIIDRRADRARLDDLRRTVGLLEEERTAFEAKLANASAMRVDFLTQTKQFQDGRVQQLEARIREVRSDLSANRARREEAAAVLQRTSELEAKGAQSRATLDKARRDHEILIHTIAATEHRLKSIEVELAAAKSGFFLGDSYNDRPRSAQRADEMQQQVADLSADLKQRESRIARLQTELASETARFADVAEVSIVAPSSGSVWEVFTAPGEQVRRGQELARMLDCNSAVVTAAVSESVYNRLRVGQPAKFRLRDGSKDLDGRIVHLTGVAAAPANFAIAPSALTRESYRVTVRVPDLGKSATCDLGRTGRVLFSSSQGEAAAAPAK